MSPLGIEVASRDVCDMDIGTTLGLGLVINGNRAQLDGVLVSKSSDKAIAGIRFSAQPTEEPLVDEDRRTAQRWLCPSTFLPVGVAPSPLSFNEFIYFTAIDISESGLLLQTSLSNKFLLQNSILDLTLSFPLIGSTVVSARIARVEIGSANGREHLRVGAKIIDISPRSTLLIDEYLTLFTEKGIQATGEVKNSRQKTTKGLFFRDIRSQDDILAVISLRNQDGNATNELSDIDFKSRILLSGFNGKPVATARVRLLTRDDTYLLDARETTNVGFPDKHQTVEISELHLAKGLSSKVIYALFQHIVVSCVTAKRPNVLVLAKAEHNAAMEFMGFSELHIATTNQRCWCTNAITAMTGRKVQTLAWITVWKDVAIQLTENNILQLSGTEKILLKINILIGRILRLLNWE